MSGCVSFNQSDHKSLIVSSLASLFPSVLLPLSHLFLALPSSSSSLSSSFPCSLYFSPFFFSLSHPSCSSSQAPSLHLLPSLPDGQIVPPPPPHLLYLYCLTGLFREISLTDFYARQPRELDPRTNSSKEKPGRDFPSPLQRHHPLSPFLPLLVFLLMTLLITLSFLKLILLNIN